MSFLAIPSSPGVVIERQRTVWAGRFSVEEVAFRHRRFDGAMSATRTWELFRRGRAAALLPYDPWSDQVVLIEQFRLPALAAGMEPVMVEIPAGLCDGEESAEQTARRESEEEMGLAPDLVVPMLDVLLTAGGSDERCTILAGRVRAPDPGTSHTGGLAAEQEDIRLRPMPAAEAIEAAVSGRFPNSVTVMSLLWLAARHDQLRADWTR